jgi:hypothetical protein
MNVQAFIPDWLGPRCHSAEIEAVVSPFCETNVMADSRLYFTEQWNAMMNAFTGDVMLVILADVMPQNFDQMFPEMLRLMSCEIDNIGIYTPKPDWTAHKYSLRTLHEVEPMVYEVPCPDILCYAIRNDVLRQWRPDPIVNRLGWGIDYVYTAIASLSDIKTVRDYRFLATHPQGTNYSTTDAGEQMLRMFATLDAPVRNRVWDLQAERRVCNGRDE